MSVVDVIRRRTVVVALERRDGLTVVDAFHKEGTPITGNIDAHVQPAQPRDMRNAPEGQLQSETRVFWTEATILVADRLTHGGVEFIVQQVEPWDDIDGWVKAMAVEITDVIP